MSKKASGDIYMIIKYKFFSLNTVLILVLLIVSLLPLSSMDNQQKIIPVGSPVYAAIRVMYLEQGLSTPSTSGPWSVGELNNMVDRIDAKKLSAAGVKAFAFVSKELQEPLKFQVDDDFQLSLGLDAVFEAYMHTNVEQFDDEWDWVVGYTEREPIVRISFEFAMHDWFYTYSELGYKKNRYGHNDADGTTTSSFLYDPLFSTNFFDMKYVDFETPYRAFVTAGGEGWNVQFGRDLLSWGNGRTGNLVIGDHLDYHDYFSFKSYHDSFSYQFLTVFIDYPGWDKSLSDSSSEIPSVGFKAFLGHRLEFRFWDKLNVNVTENVMYQHDFFDLRYLNPAYIFHNYNNRGMFNAITSFEIDYALAPGLNIYGQYVIDQARAPLESSAQPDCMGYIIGLDFTTPLDFGPGYLVSGVEYVLTDPYLYQRDLIDFKVSRRQFIIGKSFETYTDFLGFQYGGDAEVIDLLLGYTIPGTGGLYTSYRNIVHGDVRIDEEITSMGDYPDPEDMTPHGDIPETTQIIAIMGEFDISEIIDIFGFIDLAVWAEFDFISVTNLNNVDGVTAQDVQFTFGVSASL
jgi:hypothetical protein